MLKASGIQKSYGPLRVLNNIDLQVEKGEIVAVVGASGAGKSTLLKLLTREARNTSGRVTLNGRELTDLLDWSVPASASS